MDAFEYISVLTSIIIGLGMAQLLLVVSRIIQYPTRGAPYWVHICWVIYTFIFTVFWWWWEFNLRLIETWTFGIYLLVILYAFLIFLFCALLAPSDLSEYGDFRGYFYAKRRWIFSVFLLIQVVDIGDAIIKGADYILSIGTQYYVSQTIIVASAVTAIVTRNERFHSTFVVALLAFTVIQGFLFYDTI